jgi:glycosyltransferase involved in cell wall biosynthesis
MSNLSAGFSITAFLCVYNEADILPWILRHLYDQGIGIYIIDNWSNDNSADIARSFPLVGYEKWPFDGPSQYYEWGLMLKRVEELAFVSPANWCIHHDADEIRRSSRLGETLLEGMQRVEAEGYNAINHRVYHFLPTDDLYQGDPERHFRYYLIDDPIRSPTRQVKAWKNTGQRVDLASSGGHFAGFGGIRIHPEKFILKHYPLRTAAQAERKVIHERMARYSPTDLARNWHVQYKGLAFTHNWIKDSKTLTLWKDEPRV